MRLEVVLANHRCQRICREEMLVVLEHDEMKRRDASIRGKSQCNVDLLVAQRLVGKPRIHVLDVLAAKLEPIGFLHRLEAVGESGEFRIGRKGKFLSAIDGVGQVAYRDGKSVVWGKGV